MSGMVYVVIGTSGEYSTSVTWVAGVYTAQVEAMRAAKMHKRLDRANWVIWCGWNTRFGRLGAARGDPPWDHRKCSWGDIGRSADGLAMGIGVEPPVGNPDSDYTVACVPLNTPGKWSYSEPKEC